jgi:predicted RNA binding protein YcfA (HicA-like mRNA interferase family)
MKVRDIMTRIEKDGWVMLPRTGTSHMQYKHETKPGRVTIAGHRNDDVDPKTLKSILIQAGLK